MGNSTTTLHQAVIVSLSLLNSCAQQRGESKTGQTGDAGASTTSPSEGDTAASGSSADETENGAEEEGLLFDLGGDSGGAPGDGSRCTVDPDEMDALGACEQKAPPDSFEPELQWGWTGPDDHVHAISTPLVANLTDDNGDGVIDLCDTPDIVVVAFPRFPSPGRVYILDGASGDEHLHVDFPVHYTTTPALGDLDGDGVPEIVTATYAPTPAAPSRFVAFHADGSLAWESQTTWQSDFSAVAIADLDNDGTAEVLGGQHILDHRGKLEVSLDSISGYSATTAADLDGDGDLEAVVDSAVFHHDGTLMWRNLAQRGGFPQVADLDDDGLPEVLLANANGLTLFEHDGTIVFEALRPTGVPANDPLNWLRPATIHDFDGDGAAEFAHSSMSDYVVYEADGDILWRAQVLDETGVASGTAFDFLGDGIAEAMYADETRLFVYDGQGQVLLDAPRTSRTGIEYPVVADVDNDGSAEIVVVSGESPGQPQASPTVQVLRDQEDRWIQARRIWNQHTYHVTNVREDGTIPQFEQPNWATLNTFRTNAQIEGGGVCVPPVG